MTPAAPGAERLLRSYLHKTSNSLCGIKGYASLIATPDQDTTKSAGWAEKIIREVERMEAIYRSVHDLTAPKGNPDRGVDLPGLLDDVFRVCESRCRGLQVLCGRVPRASLLLPKGDLCLVLTELLLNSVEGVEGQPGPARVEVTAMREPTGRLALRLRDNGPGIDPHLLAQACDPFVTTKDGLVLEGAVATAPRPTRGPGRSPSRAATQRSSAAAEARGHPRRHAAPWRRCTRG